jgi:hypothetical protein
MNSFEPQKLLLHRTWLRLLPYIMFGAFLILFKSAENFSDLFQNYLFLLGIQLTIVSLYLIFAQFKNTK